MSKLSFIKIVIVLVLSVHRVETYAPPPPQCDYVLYSLQMCQKDTICNAKLIQNYHLPVSSDNFINQFRYIINERIIKYGSQLNFPDGSLSTLLTTIPLTNTTPFLLLTPDTIRQILKTELCTSHSIQLLWLMILRNTYVCGINQLFDRVEGCICMDSKVCSDSLSPSINHQTIFVRLLIFLFLIGIVSYLFSTLNWRRIQRNFGEQYLLALNFLEKRWNTAYHASLKSSPLSASSPSPLPSSSSPSLPPPSPIFNTSDLSQSYNFNLDDFHPSSS